MLVVLCQGLYSKTMPLVQLRSQKYPALAISAVSPTDIVASPNLFPNEDGCIFVAVL